MGRLNSACIGRHLAFLGAAAEAGVGRTQDGPCMAKATMTDAEHYWDPPIPPEQLGDEVAGPALIKALQELPALRTARAATPTMDELRSWYVNLDDRCRALFSHYKEFGRYLDLNEGALPIVLDPEDQEVREQVAKRIWARFPGAEIVDRKRGTAGIVWILENAHGEPRRFAVKSPDPQVRKGKFNIEALAHRELYLWYKLPHHINVMPALGFELLGEEVDPARALPVVWMPCASDSLRDRLGGFAEWEALWILGQLVEGMLWLHENGFEGHGDLKPENVLLTRGYYDRFRGLPESHPGARSGWLVQVSDLGWADAWRDLNEFRRAWRPYLAPERLDGSFKPELSDVFSIGVISCEVFSGRHPAGSTTSDIEKRLGSDGKWRRWVDTGERRLEGVPDALRDMIRQCLNPEPESRPTFRQFRHTVDALARRIGPSLNIALDTHTAHARAQTNYSARWTIGISLRLARVGGDIIEKELQRLHRVFITPDLNPDPRAVSRNLVGWWGIAKLRLARGTAADHREVRAMCRQMLEVALKLGDSIDLRKDWLGSEPSDVVPEETLIDYLRTVRSLKNVDDGSPEIGDLLCKIDARAKRFHDSEREDFLRRLKEQPDEEDS
jgi:serine/threonine protein kinase